MTEDELKKKILDQCNTHLIEYGIDLSLYDSGRITEWIIEDFFPYTFPFALVEFNKKSSVDYYRIIYMTAEFLVVDGDVKYFRDVALS